jgi:hypothetical protein
MEGVWIGRGLDRKGADWCHALASAAGFQGLRGFFFFFFFRALLPPLSFQNFASFAIWGFCGKWIDARNFWWFRYF